MDEEAKPQPLRSAWGEPLPEKAWLDRPVIRLPNGTLSGNWQTHPLDENSVAYVRENTRAPDIAQAEIERLRDALQAIAGPTAMAMDASDRVEAYRDIAKEALNANR